MFSIPEGIADNIRGCRFAQPPATFCNPYRGNEAMMRDNEVVNLLNHAWSEGSIEDPSIGLLAIVPSKQITLDPTDASQQLAEIWLGS
jgi:hypothetical protein